MALLLVAAAWLLGGCAGTGGSERRSDAVSQASMCAMCGASVSPGYFDYSAQRSMGPGQWW
jgi:hypothetical protein